MQKTITKAYSRTDTEPAIEILVGDIAIMEEDGWWKITDQDGVKKCRIKDKLADELTFQAPKEPVAQYSLRLGSIILCLDKPMSVGHLQNNFYGVAINDVGVFGWESFDNMPLTPSLIEAFQLQYEDMVEIDDEMVKVDVTAKFENNILNLPRGSQLEYEPESQLFMLNGMFVPYSPKYVHELQNLIFGLTRINPTVNIEL